MRPVVLSIALCSFALSGCGPKEPRTATPFPGQLQDGSEPPPQPAAPEIIKLPTSGDVPTDCVAGKPDAGLLDQTSPHYKKIEVRDDVQVIYQTAWLSGSSVVVKAQVGGCAHYGASYSVTVSSDVPATDKATHIRAAIAVVRALPITPKAESYVDDIVKPIEAHTGSFDECTFQTGEITTVYCGVEQTEPGEVTVVLALDVAL